MYKYFFLQIDLIIKLIKRLPTESVSTSQCSVDN